MTAPGPPPSAERLRALRRMKTLAVVLLIVAAAVYVVCRTVGDGHGTWGYVQATAEASMVGGIADWFAVTALFRHPLGLPIPHTAIIPRKKDSIGEGLAGFVSDYFLTSEVVGERLRAGGVPQRLGSWLADPVHATMLATELSTAVNGIAGTLRDHELRDAVAGFADRRLRELDAAPLLARLIDAVRDSGQHQMLLTTVLRGTRRFLDDNRASFRDRLSQESPEWVPVWVDERVFARGFTALQDFLADVTDDEQHDLRAGFDRQLAELAVRLRTDPDQIARVHKAKAEILDHPQVREWLSTLWLRGKSLVVDGAADPDSELRRGLEQLVVRAGEVLRDDPAIGRRVEDTLVRAADHVVANYAEDIAGIISTTVQRWDTTETSRRLELQVGRDLQFIRINGTVVGALAGLVIHALSQLI